MLCRKCYDSSTITQREAQRTFDAEDIDVAVQLITPFEQWHRYENTEKRFKSEDVEAILAEAISHSYIPTDFEEWLSERKQTLKTYFTRAGQTRSLLSIVSQHRDTASRHDMHAVRDLRVLQLQKIAEQVRLYLRVELTKDRRASKDDEVYS